MNVVQMGSLTIDVPIKQRSEPCEDILYKSNSTIGKYEIRRIKENELCQVHKMILDEGWGYSLRNIQDFFSDYAAGMWVAVDDLGRVLSHCATISLSDDVAGVYYYITRSDRRGYGIGKTVFDASVAPYEDFNIFLNSVRAAVPLYEKSGFGIKHFTMFSTQRIPDHAKLDEIHLETNICILPFSQVEFNKVAKFDEAIHPFARSWLRSWLSRQHFHSFCAMNDEQVVGYGCLMPDQNGYKLRPLYADTPDIAWNLMVKLLKSVPRDKPIEITIPCDNQIALNMFKSVGLDAYGDRYNVRMHTKAPLAVNLKKVYCLLKDGNIV